MARLYIKGFVERAKEVGLDPVGMGLGAGRSLWGKPWPWIPLAAGRRGRPWRREARHEVARGLQGDSGAQSPPVNTGMEKEHWVGQSGQD